MTRQATKKKRDKKRAEKKKHEHLTEHMHEEAAKKKRSHSEEIIAIAVILVFVPFMIIGVVWWPPSKSSTRSNSDSVLPDGRYTVSYLGSQPATDNAPAAAVLDVDGKSVFVDERDLLGSAAEDAGAFFEGQRGEPIEITVKNGFITSWTPTAPPE